MSHPSYKDVIFNDDILIYFKERRRTSITLKNRAVDPKRPGAVHYVA